MLVSVLLAIAAAQLFNHMLSQGLFGDFDIVLALCALQPAHMSHTCAHGYVSLCVVLIKSWVHAHAVTFTDATGQCANGR